jgi:hypothetical protein
MRAINQAWREANQEKRKAYTKRYREQNDERLKAYMDAYMSDPKKRVVMSIRSRARKWTGLDQDFTKVELESFLGCSIEHYLEYIQSKFTPGMGWKNYGNGRRPWEIDHIMPLSSFDRSNPEEIKRALCYTNTRPLWAKDNREKSAKIPSAT